MIPDLFEEIDGVLEKMEKAIQEDDFDTLIRLGHGYKGAAGNYQLKDLSKIFLEMEKGARLHDKEPVIDGMKKVIEFIENVEIEYAKE